MWSMGKGQIWIFETGPGDILANCSLTSMPQGNDPLALDMWSMEKRQIWINWQSIVRYWTTLASGDSRRCSYSEPYRVPKCQVGCGKPTQRWYHVPRSWLRPTQILLVVFEEIGGDASGINCFICFTVKLFHLFVYFGLCWWSFGQEGHWVNFGH